MQVLEQLLSSLSVTPTCPRCKRVIPSEDINVANDIAFCRNCDLSHRLAALAAGSVVDENVDLSRPPAGAWFQRQGEGLVVGATHRSLGQAFGLLFIALFWNGIVSVFVSLAIASTLQHLGVSLPGWFSAHFSKSAPVPLGLTVFLWLFLTPFIGVGLGLVFSFFSCLAGRTEIRLQGGDGVILSGVGPVSFRKRFATSSVRDVRIEDQCWRDRNGTSRRNPQIIIETEQKPIKFGSMLTQERRRFLAGAVKKELVHR